jgi:hypothetical protein
VEYRALQNVVEVSSLGVWVSLTIIKWLALDLILTVILNTIIHISHCRFGSYVSEAARPYMKRSA